MPLGAAVAERLARLAPDQRAAATAPPGPVLCVAPAGSGKTTTLVARVAWLVDRGTDPRTIAAITFNKRAAEELLARLAQALAPLGVETDAVRVSTFHALGRAVLMDAGEAVEPLADRAAVLRSVMPGADGATRRRLDTAISRLKLDLRAAPDVMARDPDAGPVARAYVAYEHALRDGGMLDFDDLVARALRRLETDLDLLARWRGRCANLLVDEAQDLDRSQLDLALLLAAPANQIFLVGDDDQSIYGWRLADVRRVLGLAGALPGLQRFDLQTNYRCPRPVVERAVRLVEGNRERFAKQIVARAGADGRLLLGPDGGEETDKVRRLLLGWPDDDSTCAVLARTNRELLPAVAAAVELDRPFRAPGVPSLVESEQVDRLLAAIEPDGPTAAPLLVRVGRVRHPKEERAADDRASAATPDEDEALSHDALVAALLAWAAGHRELTSLRGAIDLTRARLARLRRDDARLTLATVHGTKGLEWDHVAVLGMEAGRFPSRRAMEESAEPERATEEERRLAYVAWTRARRSLTLLYDPEAPSPFLLEAFDRAELRLPD
ncbi:MAG: ATP-dependent helicase [Chloroflexota bacterium]|nr:ATP-dependent helicase [Chloroflexota bacterium]